MTVYTTYRSSTKPIHTKLVNDWLRWQRWRSRRKISSLTITATRSRTSRCLGKLRNRRHRFFFSFVNHQYAVQRICFDYARNTCGVQYVVSINREIARRTHCDFIYLHWMNYARMYLNAWACMGWMSVWFASIGSQNKKEAIAWNFSNKRMLQMHSMSYESIDIFWVL